MQHLVLFLYMIEFTNWNLELYNTICRCSRKIMQKSTDTKWNIYLNYTNMLKKKFQKTAAMIYTQHLL